MICDKCKYEFFEGRNCPNCGNLAIFVMDDDYENRKNEWEQENKPEEVEQKKKISITVDKEKVKKAVLIGTAAVAVIAAATAMLLLILHYAEQKKYIVLYDNASVIVGLNKSISAFDSENAVFSADGIYAYAGRECETEGELLSNVVSRNGKYAAIVTVIGNDADEAEYYLYRYDRTENILTEIRHGSQTIRTVSVVNDGQVIYEAAELGSYSAIIDSSIYLYDGERTKKLAEDVSDFVSCEKDGDFLYYDTQMNVYLYSGGEITELTDDALSNEGSQFVCTYKGNYYYLTNAGDLYDAGKDKLADTGVNVGTLSNVAGTDKVTYVKDGTLYIYGSSIKTPVALIENYDYYGSRLKILENSGKIYFVYQDTLYICNSRGKVKTTKDNVQGVYFSLK